MLSLFPYIRQRQCNSYSQSQLRITSWAKWIMHSRCLHMFHIAVLKPWQLEVMVCTNVLLTYFNFSSLLAFKQHSNLGKSSDFCKKHTHKDKTKSGGGIACPGILVKGLLRLPNFVNWHQLSVGLWQIFPNCSRLFSHHRACTTSEGICYLISTGEFYGNCKGGDHYWTAQNIYKSCPMEIEFDICICPGH